MFTLKTNYAHFNQTNCVYHSNKLHTFTPNQIFLSYRQTTHIHTKPKCLSYRQTTHIHTKPNIIILQTNNTHSDQIKCVHHTDKQHTFTANQICLPYRQKTQFHNNPNMKNYQTNDTHLTKWNMFTIHANLISKPNQVHSTEKKPNQNK